MSNGYLAIGMTEYYIVFCTKYKRDVLDVQIQRRLREMVREAVDGTGINILETVLSPHEVRIRARVPCDIAPVNVVRAIKRYTHQRLRSEFPSVKRRLPSVWNRWYFCQSVGKVNEQEVQDFLASQTGL